MRGAMGRAAVVFCMCAIFVFVGSVSYATVGAPQKISSEKIAKAQQLLVDRNFGNVTITDGQERAINNGHFLSLNGIDKKTGKKYIVEIVVPDKLPEWLLLGCKPQEEIAAKAK